MSLVTSQPQNIKTVLGNGFAIFLDSSGNLQLKDVRGRVESLASFLNLSTSPFEFGSCSDSIQTVCGSNSSGANFSTIAGGQLNAICGANAFVGSGYNNIIATSNPYGTIIGGQSNRICSGSHTVIGNGICNQSYDTGEEGGGMHFMGTGCNNITYGQTNVVVNGCANEARSQYSFVGNGKSNCANGAGSVVVGGYNNFSALRAFVGAGQYNCANAQESSIIGGTNNLINAASNSVITGGSNNSLSGSSNQFIGSGSLNCGSASNTFIGTGIQNCNAFSYGAILNGCSNLINAQHGAIIGGQSNRICSGSHTVIGNGICNQSYDTGEEGGGMHFMGTGCNNITYGQTNVVVNGCASEARGQYSFVGNGRSNCANGGGAVVVGGYTNFATTNAVVTGGQINCANGQGSFIGSGSQNLISGAGNTFIGAGGNNSLSGGSSQFIGAGNLNCGSATHAFIGTGCRNCVAFGNGAIINGIDNCIGAPYGFATGRNITITANYAGAIGCGITNSCANSFMSGYLRGDNLCGGSVNICVDANGTIVRDASDARLKTNVNPLQQGLNYALNLNPVKFNWNEEAKSRFGDKCEIGFIAQEVAKVVPEAVSIGTNGEYSLSRDKITAVSIKAIQELHQIVCGLSRCFDA